MYCVCSCWSREEWIFECLLLVSQENSNWGMYLGRFQLSDLLSNLLGSSFKTCRNWFEWKWLTIALEFKRESEEKVPKNLNASISSFRNPKAILKRCLELLIYSWNLNLPCLFQNRAQFELEFSKIFGHIYSNECLANISLEFPSIDVMRCESFRGCSNLEKNQRLDLEFQRIFWDGWQ